jgi:transcription initiation factor IIE alpha subunit
MIKDIPDKNDFYAVGHALLNQSWDEAMSLLIELEDAKGWIDPDDEEEYWGSSGARMATALAIAHQAAEFYLKGRISSVSPFLLIANSAREWPAAEVDGNISFSTFRTVDAQDLVKLHDSCTATPFDQDFKRRLELLRVRRNSILHTVDKNLRIKVGELVETILEIHETLVGERWIDFRRNALEESSTGKIYYADWAEPRLVLEFRAVQGILNPSALKKYFSFDTKQRVYICPKCTWSTCRDHGIEFHSAILMPNKPDSTSVWCPVCNENQEVYRSDCDDQECRGNVISREWGRCLTCGDVRDEDA